MTINANTVDGIIEAIEKTPGWSVDLSRFGASNAGPCGLMSDRPVIIPATCEASATCEATTERGQRTYRCHGPTMLAALLDLASVIDELHG